MVYTVGPQADPDGRRAPDHRGAGRLGHGHVRRQPRVHELAVRDQPAPRAGADRRRPRVPAEVRGQGRRRAQRAASPRSWASRSTTRAAPASTSTSALDRDDDNAFADRDDADGVIAPSCAASRAGVLAHAPALMAFLNPTINAYRRHRARLARARPTPTGAGTTARRSSASRPSAARATRVEVRVGDGSANPYLAIAAILFAGLHGLREELAAAASRSPATPTRRGGARRAAARTRSRTRSTRSRPTTYLRERDRRRDRRHRSSR